MEVDVIVIADSGYDSLSVTNPLKLRIGDHFASIQNLLHCTRTRNVANESIFDDHNFSWSSAPKLNGIYLIHYLSKSGFRAELINNYFLERERFIQLLECSPKLIAVSTTFLQGKQMLRKLVADIRSLACDIPIIAGGSFVYDSFRFLERSQDKQYPSEEASSDYLFLKVENEPDIDQYVISPNGEQVLVELIHRLKTDLPIAEVQNCARLQGHYYVFNEMTVESISKEYRFIRWDLMPDHLLCSGVVPMQASNGCPYDCAFCNFDKDPKRNFVKPIELLVEEMRAVSDRGVRYIWFVDDNFRLGRKDLDVFCRRLISENLSIHWMTFIRASSLLDVDPGLLREAGCIEVQLGLESADEKVLKNMNKKSDPEVYGKVIHRLLGSGINCSCYFIFGFPGETSASIRKTVDFIHGLGYPDLDGALTWTFFPFYLVPLTPIYHPESREKYGLSGYLQHWSHSTMNAEQAKKHILLAFLELEDSYPIYREDNQELLRKLEPSQRKVFFRLRHQASKQVLRKELKEQDLPSVFTDFFRRLK